MARGRTFAANSDEVVLIYWVKRISAWFIPDRIYAKLAFFKTYRRFPNTPPVIFNEFLCDLKGSGELAKLQRYADKVTVRDHVAARIGAKYLVPLHATAERLTREVWDGLPDSFILKTNHGSAWNRPVWDKRAENFRSIAAQSNGWLKKNLYYVRREQQYKNIKPVLLFEKLLTGGPDEILEDYKFFCFHGQARFVLVGFSDDKDRRVYYDRGWARLDVTDGAAQADDVPRPGPLDEMIGVAEALARDFPFVRVDLYCTGQRVYVGELTFVPGGGSGKFRSAEFEECLGRLWMGEEVDLTPFHRKSTARAASARSQSRSAVSFGA
jgi:hypothetical protein